MFYGRASSACAAAENRDKFLKLNSKRFKDKDGISISISINFSFVNQLTISEHLPTYNGIPPYVYFFFIVPFDDPPATKGI